MICVEVNGKNAYGGYVGFEENYLHMRNGTAQRIKTDAFTASPRCRAAASNNLMMMAIS